MSAKNPVQQFLPDPEHPLRVLEGALQTSGLGERREFAADVGIPYHGDLETDGSYLIVGSEGPDKPKVLTPELRGQLQMTTPAPDAVCFSMSDFYMRDDSGRRKLEAVGLPRFRHEGHDYALRDIPHRVRAFSLMLDFATHHMTLTAAPAKGRKFVATFDAHEYHHPNYERVDNVDVVYRIGVVATVVAARKATSQNTQS